MNILILGATGFIGNSIFHSLVADHEVRIAGRTQIVGYSNWKYADLSNQVDWEPIIEHINLVINAIGIIEGDFQKIQTEAPLELYRICEKRNIRIIHISAIGAEMKNPPTEFLRSKKTTDSFLLQNANAKVIYPGVVLGKNGASSMFFKEITAFPIIPLLGPAHIPAIHIDQLTSLVQSLIKKFENYPCQIFAVSEPEPFTAILSAIKGKNGRFLKIPTAIADTFFSLFPKAKIGIFNKDMLTLLGVTSSLSYKPLFPKASTLIRSKGLSSSNHFPVLFAVLEISFIWVWSGISSLISWDESFGLMKEIGANDKASVAFIYLGAVVDILLGLAIFSKKLRSKVIVLQVLTMATYMAILSIAAPHYWIHPFGVLSKNIPLLALSYYLFREEARSC